MQILVVCTANTCRSPMAERLLRRAAATHGTEAGIASAGLRALGEPATPEAVTAASYLGIDLGAHQSRPLGYEMLRAADLVLTMETRHVYQAAELAPERFGSIFTMRELVIRGQQVGPRGERSLPSWLAELADGRHAADLFKATHLDVLDPYGGPEAAYMRTAAELADLSTTIAALLWRLSPPASR